MSDIAKLIDDVVRRDLARRLKSDGYRKSGRTFYRSAESCTAVVNVQASKHNHGNNGTFTVNLGVYFPDVATITNALPFTGAFPKEYDCTVRQRLGVLKAGGDDYWWPVNVDSDIDAVAETVTGTWSQHGQPWIERVSDLDAAHNELVSQNMFFVAAAISVLQGRRDEAAELVRKAQSRQPMAARRIQQWAREHELV
tara:strand:+ start:1722 stop:2312 length:591 start_codon:yes stop_codon:yes gene_type:complete